MNYERLHVGGDFVGSPLAFGQPIPYQRLRGVRRYIAVRQKRNPHRHSGVIGSLQDTAIAKQAAVTDIYYGNGELPEWLAKFSGNRWKQDIFGVAFDDDEATREEEIGLGCIEKSTQKCVVVVFQFRMVLAERIGLVSDDHHHGIKVRVRGELGAVGAQENLNSLTLFALRNRRCPRFQHLHEKRLMLRVKMCFWLFDEQIRNLIGAELKEKKLGRHE